MDLSSNVIVLVLVLDEDVGSGLRELANRREWIVVQIKSIDHAIQRVQRLGPQVVIIQFANHLQQAEELIEALRARWPGVPLIAYSSLHEDKIERSVRSAGVSCYFSGSGGTMLVDQAVDAILRRNATMAGTK